MNWLWKKFDELTPLEIYEVLALRGRVFVVEQNCVYQDCDGADLNAWHLLGFEDGVLVAYLRAFPPGARYQAASIGRVVTAPEVRRKGHGKNLILQGLQLMKETFGKSEVRISAQSYLKKFYADLGFRRVDEVEYLEDGIPHVAMILE